MRQTGKAVSTQAKPNGQIAVGAPTMKILRSLIASCLVLSSNPVAEAKKLVKVKIGHTYKEKEEVHVVVNSVG